ncbi:hypothetical protein BLOT_007819 [Blomia tropicalis]|nr:hypothetical protein BLOT_007819 [Blomia tropicalis]
MSVMQHRPIISNSLGRGHPTDFTSYLFSFPKKYQCLQSWLIRLLTTLSEHRGNEEEVEEEEEEEDGIKVVDIGIDDADVDVLGTIGTFSTRLIDTNRNRLITNDDNRPFSNDRRSIFFSYL